MVLERPEIGRRKQDIRFAVRLRLQESDDRKSPHHTYVANHPLNPSWADGGPRIEETWENSSSPADAL